ncbi:MAG: hypothetical protein ABI150_01370, partial [Nitrobacter sp.]
RFQASRMNGEIFAKFEINVIVCRLGSAADPCGRTPNAALSGSLMLPVGLRIRDCLKFVP